MTGHLAAVFLKLYAYFIWKHAIIILLKDLILRQ